MKWMLLAGFAALAVGLTVLGVRMYSERSGWEEVSTEIGDYRRLPLADGSTLELNTATEVRYRLSEKLRELNLTAGEARFRVAHDVGRPFVVSAGNTVIRAVGTEFTVRIRDAGEVDVVVSEGVVAVVHRTQYGLMHQVLYGREAPALEGGQRVEEYSMVTDNRGRFSVAEMTRRQIEDHDAWRNNMIVFEEMPLREIVAEFNRYNRRKLAIVDPVIANVPFGGRYRPRDVEGFLENLEKVMKVRVVASGGNALQIYDAQGLGGR